MTRLFLGLAAMAFAAPALAESTGLQATFGNTIVSTYPDGRTAELWLHPDGSYSAEGRRHDRSEGHWKVRGEKLCLKQSHPLSLPFTFCTPMFDGAVGASWTGKAVTAGARHGRSGPGRGMSFSG
jgi:hypothetical protein